MRVAGTKRGRCLDSFGLRLPHTKCHQVSQGYQKARKHTERKERRTWNRQRGKKSGWGENLKLLSGIKMIWRDKRFEEKNAPHLKTAACGQKEI